MVDSILTLKLPAVVWVVSTLLVLAGAGGGVSGAVGVLAWTVFLAGIGYFFLALAGRAEDATTQERE